MFQMFHVSLLIAFVAPLALSLDTFQVAREPV